MDGNQCLANVRLVKCVLGGGGAYITTVNTVCDISSYHCRCMLSKYLHPQNLKKGFQSQYLPSNIYHYFRKKPQYLHVFCRVPVTYNLKIQSSHNCILYFRNWTCSANGHISLYSKLADSFVNMLGLISLVNSSKV